MNYIEKFWNGDVRLVISYWVVGGLLSIPAAFVGVFLSTLLFQTFDDHKIFYAGWMIFTSVGIWRSADKYWRNPKNQGKKGWAIAAKIGIGLGWIVFFNALADPYPYPY